MENDKFKKELKRIIDSLGWHGIDKCPNCDSMVKFSVIDSDEGAICPKCGKTALIGGLRLSYSNVELYRTLFLDAVYLTISEYFSDLRSALITAFTSLEVFLNVVIEYQFKKRKTDDRVIECILIKMKPNLRFYKELLEAVNIKIKEKHWNALWEVAKIRDDIAHRGIYPKDKDIVKTFDKISKIFMVLSEYYLSDIDEGKVPRELIEEI